MVDPVREATLNSHRVMVAILLSRVAFHPSLARFQCQILMVLEEEEEEEGIHLNQVQVPRQVMVMHHSQVILNRVVDIQCSLDRAFNNHLLVVMVSLEHLDIPEELQVVILGVLKVSIQVAILELHLLVLQVDIREVLQVDILEVLRVDILELHLVDILEVLRVDILEVLQVDILELLQLVTLGELQLVILVELQLVILVERQVGILEELLASNLNQMLDKVLC